MANHSDTHKSLVEHIKEQELHCSWCGSLFSRCECPAKLARSIDKERAEAIRERNELRLQLQAAREQIASLQARDQMAAERKCMSTTPNAPTAREREGEEPKNAEFLRTVADVIDDGCRAYVNTARGTHENGYRAAERLREIAAALLAATQEPR